MPSSSSLPDQPGGELCRVKRHPKIGGEIGDRADMILMAMGQHDAEQIVGAFLDESSDRAGSARPRIAGIGKGQAEIDHHPFALGAIKIDVHADLPEPPRARKSSSLPGFVT
jgi:hypothetical protein